MTIEERTEDLSPEAARVYRAARRGGHWLFAPSGGAPLCSARYFSRARISAPLVLIPVSLAWRMNQASRSLPAGKRIVFGCVLMGAP